MSKHTPGPWLIDGIPYNGYDDPVVYSGAVLNSRGDGQYICQTTYDMQSITQRDSVEADTRLIAAAPDMLEACQVASDIFLAIDCTCTDLPLNYECLRCYGMASMQAAIAKATGDA